MSFSDHTATAGGISTSCSTCTSGSMPKAVVDVIQKSAKLPIGVVVKSGMTARELTGELVALNLGDVPETAVVETYKTLMGFEGDLRGLVMRVTGLPADAVWQADSIVSMITGMRM